MKKNTKSIVFTLVFLSAIFSFNFAYASILSNFNSGMADLRNLIHLAIRQIRTDFCTTYSVSVSSGLWGPKDFRARIGKDICNNFKIQVNSDIASDGVNIPVAEVTNVTRPDSSTATVSSEHLPSPLVGDTSGSGSKLNANEIIYWTNIERTKSSTGLKTLTENSILDQIALARVQDMFAKGYFAHDSPTGDNAIKMSVRYGYEYISIGENIALGNYDGSRDLVNAWMNSPGHRANILNTNYTEIGVAAVEGSYNGKQAWISAQIFGRPLSDCVSADPAIKAKILQDKAQAESLNTKLNSIKAELETMSGADTDVYNAKVAEYNSTAKQYNNLVSEIKTLTATYNSQVQIFNECIKSA